MQFLSTISYQMWRVQSRFWNIVLSGNKKGITLLILFFAVPWIYQKYHYDLHLRESSRHLLHNFWVFLAHDKHADRWLDCVFTFTRLWKKCLHPPSHLRASKEVTSVCSCWTRWELDESLISLRTGWWKWRVRMHTFVPSDENVTIFFCARRYIRSWKLKPTFLI